jgi:hypothetical protein
MDFSADGAALYFCIGEAFACIAATNDKGITTDKSCRFPTYTNVSMLNKVDDIRLALDGNITPE